MRHFLVSERRFLFNFKFLFKKNLALIVLSVYVISFTTFRPPFKIEIGLSAQNESRAILVRKFAFMKNHKCASTTIDNIIFRFAEKNNLNLVLPTEGNYLSKTRLFNHTSLHKTQWRDLNFDIFCLHSRWNRNEVMKVLAVETVPTFTVVRDPVDLFVSMFHYLDPFRTFYKATDIHDMVKKVGNASFASHLRQRWMNFIGRNQMAWDMGLSADIYDDQDAMKAEIERLDCEFDLVMVTNRMEESLVLLHHLLNWTTEDVVHLNLNRRKLEKSPELTSDERQVLAKWLAADVLIYQHFSRRFDERVAQFNDLHRLNNNGSIDDEPMEKEVKLLQEANKKMYDRCVLQEVGNENLSGEFQGINNNVIGFLVKEKENGCAMFARSPQAYLTIFEDRLYSQLKEPVKQLKFRQFKRVVETNVKRLESKNIQLESLIEQKDKQFELLAAKVAQLELSLQNEQPSFGSITKAAAIHTEEVITVTNGEKDGRWGRLESCPTGSRAVGYQTQNKFEADNTGLNTLLIFCDDPLKTKISSPVGFLGDWQPVSECAAGSYMTNFRMRVSPAGRVSDRNTTDNMAINTLRFMCSDGSELRSEGNMGGTWGDYSGECLDGICGMETRLRSDGGLNDVRFTCCTPDDIEPFITE